MYLLSKRPVNIVAIDAYIGCPVAFVIVQVMPVSAFPILASAAIQDIHLVYTQRKHFIVSANGSCLPVAVAVAD